MPLRKAIHAASAATVLTVYAGLRQWCSRLGTRLVAQAGFGRNAYRNLVSSCMEWQLVRRGEGRRPIFSAAFTGDRPA